MGETRFPRDDSVTLQSLTADGEGLVINCSPNTTVRMHTFILPCNYELNGAVWCSCDSVRNGIICCSCRLWLQETREGERERDWKEESSRCWHILFWCFQCAAIKEISSKSTENPQRQIEETASESLLKRFEHVSSDRREDGRRTHEQKDDKRLKHIVLYLCTSYK